MTPTNQIVPGQHREAADLLEQQTAKPFRVRAYREASQSLAGLEQTLGEIHERAGIAGPDTLLRRKTHSQEGAVRPLTLFGRARHAWPMSC